MTSMAAMAKASQALELHKIQMEIQMEQAKLRLWEEQQRQDATRAKREQLLTTAARARTDEQERTRRM